MSPRFSGGDTKGTRYCFAASPSVRYVSRFVYYRFVCLPLRVLYYCCFSIMHMLPATLLAFLWRQVFALCYARCICFELIAHREVCVTLTRATGSISTILSSSCRFPSCRFLSCWFHSCRFHFCCQLPCHFPFFFVSFASIASVFYFFDIPIVEHILAGFILVQSFLVDVPLVDFPLDDCSLSVLRLY